MPRYNHNHNYNHASVINSNPNDEIICHFDIRVNQIIIAINYTHCIYEVHISSFRH